MDKLGVNAFRLSIEWSRIEPEEGKWDKKAIEHYQKVLEELKKKNITPFVTLHHFTNPLWFAKKGGWLNARSVYYFCRFVKYVANEFEGKVIFWVTINEPLAYVTQSYLVGAWPPQMQSYYKFI